MAEPIRVAIVGCGAIASAHADAILASEAVELIGACDIDAVARKQAATEWGCPEFGSVEALLEKAVPDAVCVCTPPASHRSYAEALLQAGTHVLCEKPVAPDSADVSSMLDAARRANRVLMASAKFRFVDDLVEAGRLIRDGAIGRPRIFEVAFCAPVEMAERWNADHRQSGGGVVMDNAYHAVDVLSHVIDSPVDWLSAVFPDPMLALKVEDSAEVLFRTEEGSAGRISLSWSHWTKDLDYLTVHGSTGSLRVGWPGGQLRYHEDRNWTSFGEGYDKRRAFGAQLDAFVGRIEAKTAVQPNDLIATARLVEAIYSAASGDGHLSIPQPGDDGGTTLSLRG